MNAYRYHIHSTRLSYGTKPRFITDGDLVRHTGFASLYAVTAEDSKAIEQSGTTAGFKGSVWAERLWIDLDSYEDADRAEAVLRRMELDYVAYDTGGRGAHFGVLRKCDPSHTLPQRDRAWVREHFPYADSSIYTHLHLFRLPSTVHDRTGRTKALVREVRGQTLRLPRLEGREVVLSPRQAGSTKSVLASFSVLKDSVAVDVGKRHETLVRLGYALCQDAQVDADFALRWLHEVNKLYTEPKPDEELEKIIRDVYGAVL
jgi:hypothetical protein